MSTNQSLILLNEMVTFVKVVESESFSELPASLVQHLLLLVVQACLERALGTRFSIGPHGNFV